MLSTSDITNPQKLWSPIETMTKPSPIPQMSGIYGFYFRKIPPNVPIENCTVYDHLTLLYVGIAPRLSKKPSSATLRTRIRFHLRGNAYGSTFRLSLGCLLSEQVNIKLQRSGKTLTFGKDGEDRLSQWIADNALLTWSTTKNPWLFEEYLFKTLSLPLNLLGNENHRFYPALKQIRSHCKTAALIGAAPKE